MVYRVVSLTQLLILLTTIFIVVAGNDSTIRIPWTTDLDQHGENGAYGPNGPWQALAISVGGNRSRSRGLGAYQPMWPSMYWATRAFTSRAGGRYTTNAATWASPASLTFGSWWEALRGRGEHTLTTGDLVYDSVQLGAKTTGLDPFNSTIWGISERVSLSSNHTPRYLLEVGSLGLGVPTKVAVSQVSGPLPSTILRTLVSRQKISHEGFSVHIGNVALRQPGSLILGGYEQDRVLGQVGAFHFDPKAPAATSFEVVDIHLGTQIGTSPYSRGSEDEGSVWTYSPNVDPRPFRARPSFELPYIYIPSRALHTLAKRLPLEWAPDLDLWLWNTTNPNYEKITRSSAYLGFVIRDINVH